MTDASSTTEDSDGASHIDGASHTDGASHPDGSNRSEADGPGDSPERPPSARLVDALGVRAQVRRGVAVGVALAVGVFGFFVVWPALDPTRPARVESPVLYAALAFVVATSATLLVASALAVRSVVARVMTYETWVVRASIAGVLGGGWWALTGAFAAATAVAGTAPSGFETAVRATLPLPVLVLAFGAWSALARTGTPLSDSADGADSVPGAGADGDGFDHVAARPRVATLGAVLAVVGVGALHAAAFLDTATLMGTTPPAPVGAFTVGTVTLAIGTAALASGVRERTRAVAPSATAVAIPATAVALPAAAGALAGVGAGLALGSALTDIAVLAPVGAACCLGLAWVALGVAVARDPGTYPERPL